MTGSVYEKFTQTNMQYWGNWVSEWASSLGPESPVDLGDEDSMRQRLSLAFTC
jgi:hypothetical protein